MKFFSKMYFLLAFVFFIYEGNAQKLTPTNISETTTDFSKISSTNYSSTKNAIYIKQIGNRNAIDTYLSSNKSNVEIFQIGNRNNTKLRVSAITIDENIYQIGNNNSFTNYNYQSKLSATRVIQRGYSQNLLMFGSNSISNKMTLSMQGKNQTVIVRNIRRK